jgi:hypothetical protein
MNKIDTYWVKCEQCKQLALEFGGPGRLVVSDSGHVHQVEGNTDSGVWGFVYPPSICGITGHVTDVPCACGECVASRKGAVR